MLNSMEVRKVAGAVLRTQASAFLTPTTSTRLATAALRPCQRAFSSSSHRGADNIRSPSLHPQSITSNAAKSSPEPTPAAPITPATPSTPSWAATSRSASRVVPDKTPAKDDWLTGLSGGPSKSAVTPEAPAKKDSFKMDNIFANDKDGQDISEMMQRLSASFNAPAPRVALRLTPKTGRTVSVGAGVDVGRAVRLLEQSVARNKVRAEFTAQRFHERPGLKRKRLRKQRWRKRFMQGFKDTLKRVKEMKKQGW